MKNKIRFLIIEALFVAIFTVCYFVIPYPHENNTVFVLGYVFSILAFLAQIYTFFVAFVKSKNLQSKFYGLPVVKVGIRYLVFQLVITLILTVINAFVAVPGWISVVVYLLILVLSVVGLITVEAYKEEVEKVEVVNEVNTIFLDDLKSNAKSLNDKFNYEPLKQNMKKLYELIIYSDPVSSPELASVEEEITRKFNDLKITYSEKAYERLETEIDQLTSLMEERNFRCKKLKK